MADPYDKQVEQIATKITTAQKSLQKSASYYDATYRLDAIGIAVPEPMRVLSANIGWPRMYLDSVEERLDVEGFRLANSLETVERLTDWWQANNLDEESGLAHLEAMIYGCSYITIAAPGPLDEPGVPIIRVESPMWMHADMDPRTREVTRALRVYENPDDQSEKYATLYLPDRTLQFVQTNSRWVQNGAIEHNLGIVPVVPLLNRERLSTDGYGRSEITPEIQSFTDAASRIMMDMQAAAELMAVPQRVLFGISAESLAPNGNPQEVLNAYMAQILAVESHEGKATQFQAAELRNFVEVLEELAKHVAAYTGLPPQYLSFSSENPASAEAIRSAESRLVKKAERKARMFGGAWEKVMRIATKVIDKDIPKELYRLQTIWRDPATPTYAAKADGVAKLYGDGINGIITKRRAREDMGYTEEEIAAMEEQEKDEPTARLADILVARNAPQPPRPAPTTPPSAA